MLLLIYGSIFFPLTYIVTRQLLNYIVPSFSRADHSLIAEKCVSSLQAILSTTVGLLIVNKCQLNIMTESSVLTNKYAEFALPYFLYDTVAMYITYTDSMEAKIKDYYAETTVFHITQYLRNSKPMLVHHLVFPVIFYPTILFFRRGLGDFFVGVFYCGEATIPFISLRFILAQVYWMWLMVRGAFRVFHKIYDMKKV